MNRKHAILISLLLGVAVLAGGLAVARTVGLGAPSTQAATVPDSAIAKKRAALDKYEAALDAALARKPPKLPALAKARGHGAASAVATKVVYVRARPSAAPAAGDEDHEAEHESDEGGGFDD